MTLRELCEGIGIDDDPMSCSFLIAGVLRTAVQGEASSFEGDFASLVTLHKMTGRRADDPETIRYLLDDLFPNIADRELPDSILESMVAAFDSDEANEDDQ